MRLRSLFVVVVVGVLLGDVLFKGVAAKEWQDDCVFRPTSGNATSAECEFTSRAVSYLLREGKGNLSVV